MRKLSLVLISIIVFTFTLLSFSRTSASSFKALAASEASFDAVSPNAMNEALKYFLDISEQSKNGNTGTRTPFSKSERDAAKRISSYALGLGDSFDVRSVEFAVGNDTSQNVIITKPSKNPNAKQIIFGTSYDNALLTFGSSQNEDEVSLGAFDNATGVAFLLALMDYYKDKEIEYNLVFVFFGAESYSLSGSYNYVEAMTATALNNTLLMFNVRRFGGDNLYIYSEEVKTLHNEYLYSFASDEFSKLPKAPSIFNAAAVKRLPYTHWAMIGSHSAFMNANINVANIFSGNLSFFRVDEAEARGFKNRAYTIDDTYQNLCNDFPHFKEQMSSTATLIINAISDSGFASTMEQSKQQKKDYSIWVNNITALGVLLVLIFIVALIIVLVSKYLEKKYPPNKTQQPKLKLAVFGTDYEDLSGDDIFIDIRRQ